MTCAEVSVFQIRTMVPRSLAVAIRRLLERATALRAD